MDETLDANIKEIAAGRKTFFILPTMELFPENFCEEYLIDGYECYFIDYSKRVNLEEQIDAIISIFKDVIIFFNIDAKISGISWPQFISKIHFKYDQKIPIGVLYSKRKNPQDKLIIEKAFLFDIGLMCGCIQLDYQKKANFGLIEKVLFANQAVGRRKSVRAICNDKTSTFSFVYERRSYSGFIRDISLSHFSFTLPQGKLIVKMYEKIEMIQFSLKGTHFNANAVVFTQRELPQTGEILFVCMFMNRQGVNGLDVSTKQLIIPKMYQILSENCRRVLDAYEFKQTNNLMQNGEQETAGSTNTTTVQEPAGELEEL